MEKFIETINDIQLGRRIGGGSCSDIYEMGPGVYFKRFCEDYCDLNDYINMEFLDVIRTISGIDFLPFIIRAKDIYRSKEELFGYSMDAVSAVELGDVSDAVLLNDLFLGFEGLKPSVRKLADNHVKTEDIGGDNILFNGNMYLLDLDLSLVDKRYVPDELYAATRKSLFSSIYNKITDDFFVGSVNDDDYVQYMNEIINFVSNNVGYKTETIGDFKKAYQKAYKKTTV